MSLERRFWMSPFRTAIRYFTVTQDDGKAESIGVPHFVADLAPSRSQKREAVEVAFPVKYIQGLDKNERDRVFSEQASEKLKVFGIDLAPADVLK